MKKTIFTFLIFFTSVCNALELGFYHTFKEQNPDTKLMRKGLKDIYIARHPSIQSSAILDLYVDNQFIQTNRHVWTHQISIRFTDEGRESFNRMIKDKRDTGDSIAVVLNDHIIFMHSLDLISKRTDGRPDLTMAVTLSDSDYESLTRERKKTPDQATETTNPTVTDRAPDSTLRASWVRVAP